MADNKYPLFPNIEEVSYNLRVPTNKAVRDVCEVLAFSEHKEHDERVYYAMEGEVVPVDRDENGNLRVRLENKYDYDEFWHHLASVLFVEDLGLWDADGELDENRKDELDRGEVRRALDDFLGKFGMMPYEVKSLLRKLTQNHDIATITSLVMANIVQAMKEPSVMSEMSGIGNEDFSEMSDSGNTKP